ncbi:MAG: hypothetical protein U9Q22_02470 [Candidatus Altiarchaeota archaeon]|nr:hypothetical protein [Candidatus Altiarchaeota archaeon]
MNKNDFTCAVSGIYGINDLEIDPFESTALGIFGGIHRYISKWDM